MCYAKLQFELCILQGHRFYSVFFARQSLESEREFLQKQPFITISLGENCFCAKHTNAHNLRIRSFPFDWNITPISAIYSLLSSDFDGLLDLKNLVRRGDILVNTRHQIRLMHDFDIHNWIEARDGMAPANEKALAEYARICAYYKRRIERFYLVFTMDVPLYLFRRVISSQEAKDLYAFLQNKFPKSKFTLVCIQDEAWEADSAWKKVMLDNPKIIHFRLARHEDTYGACNPVWTKIFIDLGLLK